MKMKFSEIKSKRGEQSKFSICIDFKTFYFDGEKIECPKGLTLEGKTTYDYKQDVVTLKGKLKGDLQLICSRCLDTFIYPIDVDIEERFTSSEDLQDEELILVNGDIIDITEIVERAIISTLPIKRLCKDNCKGLCQSCGVNLNKVTCSCDNEDIDLRLAGLKALFDNKEV